MLYPDAMKQRGRAAAATRLEAWQLADVTRLREHWESWKAGQGRGVSQADFAERYGLKSQGMLWQYLNGYRPLNAQAVVAFARGLNVEVQDISPRLAQEIRALSVGLVAEQPRAEYSRLDPGRRERLVEAFARLTRAQQDNALAEIEKTAAANELLVRELGSPPLRRTTGRS